MKKLLYSLLVMFFFSTAPAAQAGSGSHTPWNINPDYIDPEDFKSWQASMSPEEWDNWRNSMSPEQWEAWQATSKQVTKSAMTNPDTQDMTSPNTQDKYQQADIQPEHWQ